MQNEPAAGTVSSVDLAPRVKVVLVEPSHPGNIGGAARALKTMGLHRLAVVNPRRFPDPQAEWRAAGAQDVLEHVQVAGDLESVIAESHWVVGTSTRARRIPWPALSARELASEICSQTPETQVAILFGREASGLNNDELHRCNCHVQIPANPIYPSLNLAMAVQVVCYELYQATQGAATRSSWDRTLASQRQLDGFFEHLEGVLIASGFLDPGNPGQTMTRLRRLFLRVQLDDTEAQMLRGILRHLRPEVAREGEVAREAGQPAENDKA